jgi:hypothetical protein
MEVRPGVLPNMLLEVLTDAEPGEIKYNPKPTLRFHHLENMNGFLKEVGGVRVKSSRVRRARVCGA